MVIVHIKMLHLAFKSQRDTFFFHKSAESLDRIPDEHDHIPHADRQSLPPHLQFPEIQQLVHQLEQFFRITVNHGQPLFQVHVALLFDKCPERCQDQREGRTEFMTYIRKKAQLHLFQMLLLLPGVFPALLHHLFLFPAHVHP